MMGDIIMRSVVTEDDSKVIFLFIMVREVQFNGPLCECGQHKKKAQCEQHYFSPMYMLHIPKLNLLNDVFLNPTDSRILIKSFPSGNF